MRIAQITPLIESVPPPKYGGTERVVSVLTEELVHRGHEVTLFATADSKTRARLIPCSSESLRCALADHNPDQRAWLQTNFHLAELGEVCKRLSEFDVIHSHLDSMAFPFGASCPCPFVSTTHGRLDLPEIQQVYRAFSSVPLISISRSQRASFAEVNWVGTVYNAICPDAFTFNPTPGTYLAFLGRISPEKGPAHAIDLAIRTGLPLKIAAKVDPADREYFESVIRPRLKHPLVEYIGEIGDAEKDEFLGGALAYLFPIEWPEPFGITMIEAMACGTPVIALRWGSVPEVVADGVTGFIGDTLDDLEAAIGRVHTIDRHACRRRVEEHFSHTVMADGYEAIYQQLIAERLGVRTRGVKMPARARMDAPVRAEPRPNDQYVGMPSTDAQRHLEPQIPPVNHRAS